MTEEQFTDAIRDLRRKQREMSRAALIVAVSNVVTAGVLVTHIVFN